jgi:TrmH family RNA methyltransferase
MAGHALVRSLVDATEAAGGWAIETNADILSKLSGKDNPGAVVGVYPEFAVTLADLDRSKAGDLAGRRAAARSGQSRHDPAHRRCGRRRRADPDRRLRRSLLGRGGAGQHGGAVHRAGGPRSTWGEFLVWLRKGPGQLVGLSLDTEHDYRAPLYQTPTFLLTGNEAQGMPDFMAEACDLLVKIPMLGKADSLNAAVATAVMAYEVLAQQRS